MKLKHSLHTSPLVREQLDPYLYYIRYKTLDINASQNPFQITFNPVQNNNYGTFYRTVCAQSIPISIKDVFVTYLNKLIEYNETLDHPLLRPSHLKSPREKRNYFEVNNIETNIKRQNHSQYWLHQDIFPIKPISVQIYAN